MSQLGSRKVEAAELKAEVNLSEGHVGFGLTAHETWLQFHIFWGPCAQILPQSICLGAL